MKGCRDCTCDYGSCNWLEWMVEDAGGVCPHCGGEVFEITTTTPLGRMLDQSRDIAATWAPAIWGDKHSTTSERDT